MTLLARTLVEQGRRVAHVVHAPRDPVELRYPLTLVYLDPASTGAGVLRPLREAARVWRALRRAGAAVVVVRSAGAAVGVAALYCVWHRSAFVFSSSNVSDFTLEKMPGRLSRWLYGFGVQHARVVVIQSEEQRPLALDRYPSLRRIVRIPSFVEPPAVGHEAPGEAFLWFSRCVEQKRPLSYVDLARAIPGARFRMIPVPEGRDPTLIDDVRRAAAALQNLEVLEPLPHAHLAELVARSVAVVNTSTLEGVPNAFLEAWAAGVPVLTLEFDPDGVVERKRLGVAAKGSWDAFVAGARELWETRADLAAVSRRARDHVQTEHAPEIVGAQWAELIDGLRGCAR
jgi:glycosyltransferase involved in cell wall biosynthesis